jgi:hypothetical protein
MRFLLALTLVLGLAAGAAADDNKVPNDEPFDIERVDCDVTGFTEYIDYQARTLETDVEYWFGPIQINAGDPISAVALDINLTQTWVGDLVAELFYDIDCDEIPDVGPVSALCRPQLDGCPFPDDCCGCSGDVNGLYRFADGDLGAIDPLGEYDCPSSIPEGCFLPAIESPTGFSVFSGLPSGGCFWLRMGDAAAGDDTFLNYWSVWVLAGETANDETTWGSIKILFE